VRTIFLDTVGLIAVWDQSDQWQALAAGAMSGANVAGTQFVTTPQVLLECANAAARKQYRSDVYELREKLTKNGGLIEPTADEIEQGWMEYRRAGLGGASVVDQISFIVMRRLDITDAFSNDRHFKAAGFNTLF